MSQGRWSTTGREHLACSWGNPRALSVKGLLPRRLLPRARACHLLAQPVALARACSGVWCGHQGTVPATERGAPGGAGGGEAMRACPTGHWGAILVAQSAGGRPGQARDTGPRPSVHPSVHCVLTPRWLPGHRRKTMVPAPRKTGLLRCSVALPAPPGPCVPGQPAPSASSAPWAACPGTVSLAAGQHVLLPGGEPGPAARPGGDRGLKSPGETLPGLTIST